MQIGHINHVIKVEIFLIVKEEDVDMTATTADLTILGRYKSESEDEDESEEFAIEHAPRPPPADIMYGRKGKN